MQVSSDETESASDMILVPAGCEGPNRFPSSSSSSASSSWEEGEIKWESCDDHSKLAVAVAATASGSYESDDDEIQEVNQEADEEVYVYDSDWEEEVFVEGGTESEDEKYEAEEGKCSPEEKEFLEKKQAEVDQCLSLQVQIAPFINEQDSKIPAMLLVNEQDQQSVGRKRLARDLHKIMKQDTKHLGFSIQPKVEDCMDTWIVRLFDFPTRSFLYSDLMQLRYQFVEMEFIFPDLYPYKPPFARIVRPRFKQTSGFIIDGAICMELLSESGWNPVNDLESVIVSIRSMMVLGQARVEVVANSQERRKKPPKLFASINNNSINDSNSNSNNNNNEGNQPKQGKLKALKKLFQAVAGGSFSSSSSKSPSQRQLVQPAEVAAPKESEILIGPAGIIEEETHHQSSLLKRGRSKGTALSVAEATASQVDGGSYTYSETKRAHDYIIKYHQKKGWDRKGAWAKIG